MNEDQLKEQASILSTSGSKNSSEPTPPLFEDSHSSSDWKRFIKSELAVSSRMNDDHDGFFNIFTHYTARNAKKTIYQRTIQVYQTKASSDSTFFSSSLKYLFQAHSQTTRFTKQRIKSLIHAGNKGLWHMFLHHELEELIEYCNSLESQKDCRVLKQIFETVLLENSAIASVPPGHNIEPYQIISNSRQIQKRPIFEDNCTYQTNILRKYFSKDNYFPFKKYSFINFHFFPQMQVQIKHQKSVIQYLQFLLKIKRKITMLNMVRPTKRKVSILNYC